MARTLLWYGSHDHSASLGHAQWYLERIAHAQLTVIMGRAHCAPFERWPQILTTLVSTG